MNNKDQVKQFYNEGFVDPFDSIFYGSSKVSDLRLCESFDDDEHKECYGLDIEDIKTFIAEMKRSVIKFGKHKGKTLYYVLKNDLSYFQWMVDTTVLPKEVAAFDFVTEKL